MRLAIDFSNEQSPTTECDFVLFRKGSLITVSRRASKASLHSRKISGANLNVRKNNLIATNLGISTGNTMASCGSYNNKDDSEVSNCSMLVHASVNQ